MNIKTNNGLRSYRKILNDFRNVDGEESGRFGEYWINSCAFSSRAPRSLPQQEQAYRLSPTAVNIPDDRIIENIDFTYPVVFPAHLRSPGKRLQDPIIMLHGLNERSWRKYLPWAAALSTRLERPVLLFPIAFHIGRAPRDWSDPRTMYSVVKQRRNRYPGLRTASFANAALSRRLDRSPERFFTSGYQTFDDIVRLCTQIRSGLHPLFQDQARIDFFAYSAGAFLSQILMMVNPESHFSHSRNFMFCGGAFLMDSDPVSRTIMDAPAFEALRRCVAENRTQLTHVAHKADTRVARAFLSLLRADVLQDYRRTTFQRIADRVAYMTLASDKVIPERAVATLVTAEYLPGVPHYRESYSFPCRHETPFPLSENFTGDWHAVDDAFTGMIVRAANHLA